jgi:hypothetical protein
MSAGSSASMILFISLYKYSSSRGLQLRLPANGLISIGLNRRFLIFVFVLTARERDCDENNQV